MRPFANFWPPVEFPVKTRSWPRENPILGVPPKVRLSAIVDARGRPSCGDLCRLQWRREIDPKTH